MWPSISPAYCAFWPTRPVPKSAPYPNPFWPVPLTSLVYHDSLLHSWWEVHNYNSHYFSRTRAGDALFEYGGGRPRLMAALDALMGAPPDLFPFGAQYGWTGRRKETFLYRFRFDDPEVQLALRQALPVAQLHRRTGPQAMVHFRILSEDGYVQESAFADGTHVVDSWFVGVIEPPASHPDDHPVALACVMPGAGLGGTHAAEVVDRLVRRIARERGWGSDGLDAVAARAE